MGLRTVVPLLLPFVVVAACSGGPSATAPPGVNDPCYEVAFFEGREYSVQNAIVHPAPGEAVGRIRIPGCFTGRSETLRDIWNEVARLPGVEPSRAVVDTEDPEVIYVSADLDHYPAALDRYFTMPRCDPELSPIYVAGPWLSIPGTDANTEPDPVPPYQVELLVAESSARRYENTEILIVVPPGLGMPIAQEDIEESLWGGGSLRVTATCEGRRFVAEGIEVVPPLTD